MIHALTNPFSAFTVMCHGTDCNTGNTLYNIKEDRNPNGGWSSGSWRVNCGMWLVAWHLDLHIRNTSFFDKKFKMTLAFVLIKNSPLMWISSNFLMRDFLDAFFRIIWQTRHGTCQKLFFFPDLLRALIELSKQMSLLARFEPGKEAFCPGCPSSLSWPHSAPEWDIINYETCDSSFYKMTQTLNYSCYFSRIT